MHYNLSTGGISVHIIIDKPRDTQVQIHISMSPSTGGRTRWVIALEIKAWPLSRYLDTYRFRPAFLFLHIRPRSKYLPTHIGVYSLVRRYKHLRFFLTVIQNLILVLFVCRSQIACFIANLECINSCYKYLRLLNNGFSINTQTDKRRLIC